MAISEISAYFAATTWMRAGKVMGTKTDVINDDHQDKRAYSLSPD